MFYAKYKGLYISWVSGQTFAVNDITHAMRFDTKKAVSTLAEELGVMLEVQPC